MTLFNQLEVTLVTPETLDTLSTLELSEVIDHDLNQLNNDVTAYSSLSEVQSAIASEGLGFHTPANIVLFNEYINLLGNKLGVSVNSVVATEAMVGSTTGSIHHTLALEGIVAKLWDTIKSVFARIGKAMAEFFKKHFTRAGIIKKRLENLKAVLAKTDKDLKHVDLAGKVPSKIASAFPVDKVVTEDDVLEAIGIALNVKELLRTVNTKATTIAYGDIVDQKLVAEVKNYTAVAKDASSKINPESDTDKLSRKAGSLPLIGNALKTTNAKENDRNSGKAAVANHEAGTRLDVIEGKVNDNAEAKDDGVSDDELIASVKKELESYYSAIEEDFKKIVNKPMPGGKTITKVTVSQDSGIEIETDTNKDTPSSVNLGTKTSLIKMVDQTLEMYKDMESLTKNYDKVSVTLDKAMKSADSVIKSLSGIEDQVAKDYKKVLERKVKLRIKILKDFFVNFNKINKTMFGVVGDVSEGVIVYATTSLKYFG